MDHKKQNHASRASDRVPAFFPVLKAILQDNVQGVRADQYRVLERDAMLA
jgi:hypothetical protein